MIAEVPTLPRMTSRMAKKAAKRGAGRPPKPREEKIGDPISVGFTTAQRGFIERAVEDVGGTLSDFLRVSALDRASTILDTNGNNMLDGQDKVVQLGGPGDHPVVGDWNGDGRDETGVYHALPASSSSGDAVAEAAPAVEETTVE